MDGDTETDSNIKNSHPCALDSGNPCRNDGVPQTLVYYDDRSSIH